MASKLLRVSLIQHTSRLNKRFPGNPRDVGCCLVNAGSKHCFSTSVALPKGDRVLSADSFISWDPKTPVKLHMTETGTGSMEPKLVQSVFRDTVELLPDHTALAIKKNGKWVNWTYADYYSDVYKAAKAFKALGLERFHAVGVMANNCPEWFISSLGAIHAGGLNTGIYNTNSPELTSYICNHAPVDILVLQDQDVLDRILAGKSLKEAFPTVKRVVLIEGKPKDPAQGVMTWKDLIELGETMNDSTIHEIEKQQAVNQGCIMLYTSGTTGPPKAAIISHDNITWSARVACIKIGWKMGREVTLSYLPLSHIAANAMDCFVGIECGVSVYFADKYALQGTLVENLKEVRPTRFLGVPRVYEKIQEKMMEVGAKSGPVKKAVAAWAKNAALEQYDSSPLGFHGKQSLEYKLADKIILGNIKKALGLDRVATCYSGAAPIQQETLRYFASLGIELLNGYGATETTAIQLLCLPGAENRLGAAGKPYFGVNHEICNPDSKGKGELVVRSRNVFMGYQKDEKKTRDTFTDDFWFKTGDLATIDETGFYSLAGRSKELIITAGGENIAPVPIEDNIKEALPNVVSQVVVVGEKRKYLTALLTLKVNACQMSLQPTEMLQPSVLAWAKQVGVDNIKTVQDFLNGPFAQKLQDAIQDGFDLANGKAVSNAAKVQKFAILPNDFSIASGELGPTTKLKRFYVYEKYEPVINSMYD